MLEVRLIESKSFSRFPKDIEVDLHCNGALMICRFGSRNACWFGCVRPFPYPCRLCCGSKSWRVEEDIGSRSLAGGALLVFLGLHLVVYNFRGIFIKFSNCS